MTKLESRISLPDGRTLGYARYGDQEGQPVMYMHGFPASRIEGEILGIAANRLGISIIAPDRPGFGLSDFQPGRRILDWPEDVLRLADSLGFARFSLIGASGGCPYALACVHAWPDRVIRAGILAGIGPTTEVESTKQMGGAARLGFFLARRASPLFNLGYGALGRVLKRHPALIFRLNKVTDPDKKVLARPEVRSILTHSVEESLRTSVAGAVHEFKLLAHPWGFRLEDIRKPVHLWHGRQDGTVPHSMGEFLAEKIPDAHLRLLPDDGHISLLVQHADEILKTLCPRA